MAVIQHLGLRSLNDRYQRQRRGRWPQASAKVHPDSVDASMATVIRHVQDAALRRFTESILAEPEVQQVLLQPIERDGATVGSRIHSLHTLGMGVQDWCSFGTDECEVLYVSTLLHGIQQSLTACRVGDTHSDDILFPRVGSALHHLDDAHPNRAGLLRLCMGWAKADEESEFALELRAHMQRAVQTLDLLRFRRR